MVRVHTFLCNVQVPFKYMHRQTELFTEAFVSGFEKGFLIFSDNLSDASSFGLSNCIWQHWLMKFQFSKIKSEKIIFPTMFLHHMVNTFAKKNFLWELFGAKELNCSI